MAEILGIISSVVSIAELCSGTIRYLKAIKNAPKDCQDITRELKILETYVTDLRDILTSQSNVQEGWAQSLSALDRPGGPLREIVFLLKNLETRMKPKKRKLGFMKQRVVWAFYGHEEAQSLLRSIERATAILKAALQLDAIKLDIAIKKDIEGVREAVDQVQGSVNSLELHADFQTTLMLRSVESNNHFGLIGRSRDHSLECIDGVRNWFYHTVSGYARAGKLAELTSTLLSSPKLNKFSPPRGLLTEGNEFQFKGWLNSTSVEDFGHNPEHAFSILVQLDDILRWHRFSLAEDGVSLPWQCLHDVVTRRRIADSSHFSLFQTILAEDGRKLVASLTNRWHFASFSVRTKCKFTNWPGGFFLSYDASEMIHIFGVQSSVWYGISETGYLGYVCPRHVRVEDWQQTSNQEVYEWSPREVWSGVDIHATARQASPVQSDDTQYPLLAYEAGDIVHVFHSADYPSPKGFEKYWYGTSESDGTWGFIDPAHFVEARWEREDNGASHTEEAVPEARFVEV